MDLGNPLETVVHYLIIGGITFHSHHDSFPMVSALESIITHCVGPMMNHDISYWVVIIHQATILHGLSTR